MRAWVCTAAALNMACVGAGARGQGGGPFGCGGTHGLRGSGGTALEVGRGSVARRPQRFRFPRRRGLDSRPDEGWIPAQTRCGFPLRKGLAPRPNRGRRVPPCSGGAELPIVQRRVSRGRRARSSRGAACAWDGVPLSSSLRSFNVTTVNVRWWWGGGGSFRDGGCQAGPCCPLLSLLLLIESSTSIR